VKGDEPAQHGTDRVLGQEVENGVRRIEGPNLDVVQEWTAAVEVGAPARKLAVSVVGADEKRFAGTCSARRSE
jgi:hypothetical protein